MTRIKRGKSHLKRRKNLLRQAKGYRWGRKNLPKLAKVAVVKAGVYAYRDRRVKKREKRQLWQVKINAAARLHGLSYSRFMHLLEQKQVGLDRKVLARLAEEYPKVFAQIVDYIGKEKA